MSNNEKYTYRVIWSEEDGEYVGLCAEFPSLSHLDKEQAAALNGIVRLVGDVVDHMMESGEEVPKPFSLRDYKGTITARVPPELHRELVTEAAEQGVSLNRLVSQKLSRR